MKFQIFILFAFFLGIFAAAPKPVPKAVPASKPVVTAAAAADVPDVCSFVPKEGCYLLSQNCVVKDKKCVFKHQLPKPISPKDMKQNVKPQAFDPCALLSAFLCAFSSNNVCYVDSHGHCASRIPIPGSGH